MLALLVAAPLIADAPQATLITRFASPTVPSGGTAQIQLFLAEPHAFATGSVIVDFDATVFGDILAADVFSATGDQFGTANIKGSHVDVEFQSTTGEIGRLPNVPVVTIAVQVLAGAANFSVGSVSVTTGAKPWIDAGGNTYTMSLQPGSLGIGGNLSVEEVRHGGGMLPAGTVIGIAGTGFTPDTTVQIDGVNFASVQLAGPQQINLTLTARADLTGKHVIVRNPDGAQVDYVSNLRGFIVENAVDQLKTVQPIFPQQTYTAANPVGFPYPFFGAVALENQSLDPVSVTFDEHDSTANNAPRRFTTTLPSGGIYMTSVQYWFSSIHHAETYIYSSAPIRIVELSGGNSVVASLTAPAAAPRVLKTTLQSVGGFQPLSTFLSWDWQIGSAAPVPKSLNVSLSDAETPFVVSAMTASGGQWLSVSPTNGTTCYSRCGSSSTITVSVDPSSLPPGVYTGTITVNLMDPNAVTTTASVTFHVTTDPVISVPAQPLLFYGFSPGSTPDPLFITVTSSADPAAISVTTSTDSGANWLSVTPSETHTPATLTVSANPAVLSSSDRGTITIAGPANSPTVVANIQASFLPPPNITASPSSLVFSAKVGSSPPPLQSISVSPYNVPPFFTAVSTVIGGDVFTDQPFHGVSYAKSNWLTVEVTRVPDLSVIVDPTGLAAGAYEGTITIWSVQVPVKLIVWDGPAPAITVTPSALLLSAPIGGSVTKTLRFATGEVPVPWTIAVATTDPYGWLSISNSSSATASSGSVTPATVDITATARLSAPGTYHGMVTINALVGPVNLVTVPVTLTVTAAQGQAPQPGPPLATFLVNSASALPGAIAPGEIVTILGQNIGPPDPVGSAIEPIGEAPSNLAGTRVLFDGIAAPLLYASATQVNAIAPYEVATSGTTTVEVEYNGVRAPAGGFVLTAAAPAIFTADSSGQGPAKARNADYSVNSAQNPAARGSMIHVYATGEGATSPPGITGDASAGKRPLLPVKVTIGGADAIVQDAVSLAGTTPWVVQVNALVPQGITPDDSVPIVLTIGGARSQDRVTIAVQ